MLGLEAIARGRRIRRGGPGYIGGKAGDGGAEEAQDEAEDSAPFSSWDMRARCRRWCQLVARRGRGEGETHCPAGVDPQTAQCQRRDEDEGDDDGDDEGGRPGVPFGEGVRWWWHGRWADEWVKCGKQGLNKGTDVVSK